MKNNENKAVESAKNETVESVKNEAVESAKEARAARTVEEMKALFAKRKQEAEELERKELEEKALKKEEREAQMDKIPVVLKLLCCRVNRDGNKFGLLLLEGKSIPDRPECLSVPFPDKQYSPLISGWLPIDDDNVWLFEAPALSDVPCLIGKSGNFVTLMKVLNVETYKQMFSMMGLG